MEIVALQPLLCSVVAACLAAVHGYGWWLRRHRGHTHLWLAVGAVGTVGIAVSTAVVYGTGDADVAERWQRIMLSCAGVVLLGFHAFTRSLLQLPKNRLDPVVDAAALVMLAQGLWPGLVFGGDAITRTVGGVEYAAREIGPVGLGFLAGCGAIAVYLPVLWIRNRARIGEHRRILSVGVFLLVVAGLNDMLVGLRVYDGPLLVVFGYTALLVSFSAILVRLLARAMDDAELSAERLHELVEQRTEELRQKDVQLAHGDQMATIGTLAANIAHEINNPIAFVQTNLNQLETLWHKPDPDADGDDVHEILMECRDGVDRVRAIVADLLSIARRSDGRDEPVDLREVVESTLPILRREAKYRARLSTNLANVPPVTGDPRLLGQVVLNLAINALHALPERGGDDQQVEITTSSDGRSVRLTVRDTGTGIPDDVLPHIYDPFFTTKKPGQGTGLGLAVTQQLVTRHRGRIAVETGRDGTTMTVELPVADTRLP